MFNLSILIIDNIRLDVFSHTNIRNPLSDEIPIFMSDISSPIHRFIRGKEEDHWGSFLNFRTLKVDGFALLCHSNIAGHSRFNKPDRADPSWISRSRIMSRDLMV